jgi:cytochrome c-type biogenesis protein CcmH
MKRLGLIVGLAMSLALVAPALAQFVETPLAEAALEARARALNKHLRCLVCQNQSIDSSNAGLAADMRQIVRERVVAGDSDSEVIDFFVERYGDWVLLEPPFRARTVVLWVGPFVVLILGAAGLLFYRMRRRATPAAAAATLSEDERRRVEQLLDGA